jgi:hypothetical protein
VIVLDTSGLLAAVDSSQRHHQAARGALEADDGPFLLSPFVLGELDYLVSRNVGNRAALALLEQVAGGAYRLEPFGAQDVDAAAGLIRRYASLDLGLADASIVVLAARAGTIRLLTLDERHFRAVRPLKGRSFKLLPADA